MSANFVEAMEELEAENAALKALVAEMVEGMDKLYRGYVTTLEHGRDRIIFLGGECDPVDVMERGDPVLAAARALITRAKEAVS